MSSTEERVVSTLGSVVTDLLRKGDADAEEIRETLESVVKHAQRRARLLRLRHCDSSLFLAALEVNKILEGLSTLLQCTVDLRG
jgi:hypothetical protein